MTTTRRMLGFTLGGLLLLPPAAWSQTNDGAAPLRADRAPAELQPYMRLLGNRVLDPGAAQTALVGELVDALGNRSPARLIQRSSGQVRLEGTNPVARALVFDGARTLTTGFLSYDDQALLESVAADSALGLLAAVDRGAAVGLLGYGFRPDPGVAPNYQGPSWDIFEVVGEAATRGPGVRRAKRYYFDSDSKRLMSTRYNDGRAIETRFSNWAVVDGSLYPGRIERYENGVRVFAFTALGVSAGPVSDNDAFIRP